MMFAITEIDIEQALPAEEHVEEGGYTKKIIRTLSMASVGCALILLWVILFEFLPKVP